MSTDTTGGGWGFPLAVTPGGAFGLAGGTAKLEQSMRLILVTYPGERRMRPDFGSRLRDHVFDSPTPDMRSALAAEVRAALTAWEPRVRVTGVVVEPDPDAPGLLLIGITYRVRETGAEGDLVFPFHSLPADGG